MDNSTKVVLGALAGLAAGAALGILFAPDKGANTRKKISKKGNEYIDDLKEKFDDLMENITDKMESVKAEGDELAEKGKSKLNQSRMDHVNIADKIGSVKAGVDELVEKGKSKLNHVRVDHVK